ncbi:MAG: type III-B CRISPR module RAMP protein Cmr6 [Bacteroidales bacterium]|nr:type III-B CRISPR module RAMP protein Cmr6 [Bacteroidales bacterium]
MNIGLCFDKLLLNEYYDLDQSIKGDKKKLEDWVKTNSSGILSNKWAQYEDISSAQFLKGTFRSFEIKTIYPGLVCGIGYEHEIGYTNEFKHGFSFDYTTGLPYIPGSSVKGTLRSAFKISGYLESIIDNMQDDSFNPETSKNKLKIPKEYKSHIKWDKLEKSIFEGKEYLTGDPLKSNKIDVFFDSFIYKVERDMEFLHDDYTTSHRQEDGSYSPLKEPNPIRFIKVRPEVTFKFQFRLSETVISNDLTLTEEIKLEIFKMILLDFGIGAKTNVGYGQFTNN